MNTIRRGFSLFELLVVVAILAVLAGILFPVFASATMQASNADTISKLRQLGQAANLYEQASGEYALRTTQLVDAGLIPVEICSSREDSSKEGISNEFINAMGKRYAKMKIAISAAPYKNSFVGTGEYGGSAANFAKVTVPLQGAGWLIDMTTAKKGVWPYPEMWEGRYRRLLMDGSVAVRTIKDLEGCSDGKPCRYAGLLFADEMPKVAPWTE